MRRSVIWVGAVALAAAILLVTSPAPPAAARGADEAQVAKVREILAGLGYTETPYVPDSAGREVPALKVDAIGAPGLGDEIPPECQQIPIVSEAGPTVIGTQIAYDDRPGSMSPGDTRTYFTVYLFSTEYVDCANAWAKQQYDFMSGKSPRYRDGDPFTVGGSPAVVARNYFRSKMEATRGNRIYSMSGSDGTLNCGNIRVDLGNVLMDSQGERNYHAELTAEAKAKARQKLTEIGQALANANVCTGSWQSPASATPGPFAVGLGCQYSAEEGVLCSTRTSNQPAGAGPDDITYEWSWDGSVDGRTTGDTYARPDGEVTSGDHAVTVRAIDKRTSTRSSSERWTFTKPGGGGGQPGTGGEEPGTGAEPPAGPAAPGFSLSVSCTKGSQETGLKMEVPVACEAKPSGQPAGAPLEYSWTWDGKPVKGGPVLLSQTIAPGDTAAHVVTVQATDPKSGATSPVASTYIGRSISPLSFVPLEVWAGVNEFLTGKPDPTPPDPSKESGGTIVVAVLLGAAAAAAAALGGKASDSPLVSGLATAAGGVADAVAGITAPASGVKAAAGPSGSAQGAATGRTAVAGTPASGSSVEGDIMVGATSGDPFAAIDGSLDAGHAPQASAPAALPSQPGSSSPAPNAAAANRERLRTGDEVMIGASASGDPFSALGEWDPRWTEAAEASASTGRARDAVEDLAAINVGTPSDHLERVDRRIALEAEVKNRALDKERAQRQVRNAAARVNQLEKDGQTNTDAYQAASTQFDAADRRVTEAVEEHGKALQSLNDYLVKHPDTGSSGTAGGSGKPGGPAR